MSADSRLHNDTPLHAEEGAVLCTALSVGVAVSIDCSAFADEGCQVIVAHNGGGVLGYKFSSNPTATAGVTIDLAATSGALACAKLVPQSVSPRGFIPKGKPYLHLLATAIANISVHRASTTR